MKVLIALVSVLTLGCSQAPQPAPGPATAQNVVLVTIDTLRADRVGAYGSATARTPVMDMLARDGVRFTRAYATAPITLTSHASLLTGRYPAGHGARHNGIAMNDVPTIATHLKNAGFATGAFVSAFPLDRRFGLTRGFDEYDDDLGRGRDGRPLNERPASDTLSRAITWLDAHRGQRFFLWLHLFEPHAPYGTPPGVGSRESGVPYLRSGGSLEAPSEERRTSMFARYDEEVATADAAVGRLIAALGDLSSSTLVIVTSDHGEAFGEHGEIGHSIFVYDTTLQVPLILRGPRVPSGRTIDGTMSLIDLAPTMLALLGQPSMDVDGVSMTSALEGPSAGQRAIYAESFAPLFDFGWSPLRTIRDEGWKYIAAPRPELFDLGADAGEERNLIDADAPRAARMSARVDAIGGPEPSVGGTARPAVADAEARRRLDALGYVSGGASRPRSARPDPKDRIHVASRLARVMAGEVEGQALVETLEAILADDPANPQAHLRLGYAHLQSNRCDRAAPHLRAALEARVPSADAGLGLAGCLVGRRDLAGATAALREADRLEPGNPVVKANLGLIALERNETSAAITELSAALAADPMLLEARFALARALARQGRREEAAREAAALLQQLPPDAPQRPEVERLLAALR